jgi:hypothetical protein
MHSRRMRSSLTHYVSFLMRVGVIEVRLVTEGWSILAKVCLPSSDIEVAKCPLGEHSLLEDMNTHHSQWDE